MNQHLLFIGCGFQGLKYITQGKEMSDVKISLIEDKKKASIPKLSETYNLCDKVYYLDNLQTESIIQKGLDIHKHEPIDGIIGFSEPHIYSATLLAELLELPSPGLKATTLSQNKSVQRSYFKDHGALWIPFSHTVYECNDIEQIPDHFQKYIVKPIDQAGNIGIEILESYKELKEYLNTTHRFPLQVEEWINGEEYSVESLVHEGRVLFENITEKEVQKGRYPLELSHTIPANTESLLTSTMQQVNQEVIKHIKMKTGVLHLEVMCANDKVYITEFAVRTPGGYILDCIEHSYGIQIFAALIQLHLNQKPNLEKVEKPKVSVVRFLVPNISQSGMIQEVKGLSFLKDSKEIKDFYIDTEIDKPIHPIKNGLERKGYYLACFDSYEQKDLFMKQIEEELKVKIKS